ncbi:unnamed protein product [Lathyrus oleraceus]
MSCAKDIMGTLCNMSEQCVSNDNTRILFSRNTSTWVRRDLIRMSGYKETKELGIYLGVSVMGRRPRRRDFNHIMENIKAKLTIWKTQHSSFTGRATLAKVIIEAIPTYTMMNCALPKAYIKEI